MKDNRRFPSFDPALGPGPFASLFWPKLLHAAGLALRPQRVLLGMFGVLLIALADRLPVLWNKGGAQAFQSWLAGAVESLGRVRSGLTGADPGLVGGGLGSIFISSPRELFAHAPLGTLVTLLISLPAWALLSLAVCRSCATEFALGERLTWPESVAFARSRWLSGIGVLLSPWIVLYSTILLLAILGWVLLRWPYVQVLGGAVYVIALPLGVLGVVVLLGLLLGGWMLVPAVACEGSDWIDGVQRVYAYAVARPARLAAYLVVLAIAGVLCIGAAWVVTHLIAGFTFRASMLWLPDTTAANLSGRTLWMHQAADASDAADAIADTDAGGSAARGLVGFWTRLPLWLALGYAASYICCAGTVLYLTMRRVCDGQDIGELWKPGMIPGTGAPVSPEGEEGDDE